MKTESYKPSFKSLATGLPNKVNGVMQTVEAASNWSKKHPNPFWKRNKKQKAQ